MILFIKIEISKEKTKLVISIVYWFILKFLYIDYNRSTLYSLTLFKVFNKTELMLPFSMKVLTIPKWKMNVYFRRRKKTLTEGKKTTKKKRELRYLAQKINGLFNFIAYFYYYYCIYFAYWMIYDLNTYETFISGIKQKWIN